MTSPPTHPDLLALLRGELDNAEILEAADHLDECDDCRRELVLTSTGHALVTSSARTLGRAASRTVSPMTAPPTDAAMVLPPLADVAGLRRRQVRTRVTQALVAAAAIAVVAAGGYAVGGRDDRALIAVPAPTSTPTPTGTPNPTGITLSAVLTPVEGSASGTVNMTDDGVSAVMQIETDRLRPTKPGQFYYAWLLDPVTNKMLPLGQVGPGGTASFEVTPELLASYSAVDVSLETDNGNPGHSPHSVLRAVYA